ncbi:MAG: hypothetical protein U0996_00625 [Planctomycetaceae bacterium]
MNARLSLLVLVVFTFMAIWDADRQGKPVRPAHAPQPLSWHLPLPAHPDATAMSPTPIVASDVLSNLPISDSLPLLDDAVIEQHLHEVIPTIPVTDIHSLEIQHSETPDAKDEPAETSHTDATTALSTIEVTEPKLTEPTESTPIAATETVVLPEPGVISESQPDNAVFTETLEDSTPASTEVAKAESPDSSTTEIGNDTAVTEAAPPENLHTSEHWEAERVLFLSRSALAPHERSTTPISPELFIDEKVEVNNVVAETRVIDEATESKESTAADSAQTESLETPSATVTSGEPVVSNDNSDVDYLPVPKNLGSGTWQLISQDGEMLQITITRPEASSADVELTEKYATGIDPKGKRWAFVRLQTPTEEAAKVTEAPVNTEESEPVSRPVQKAATEFFSPSTR